VTTMRAGDGDELRELRADLHDRLRRATDLPMLLLSIAFIAVIVWPIAMPHLSASARTALTAADDGLWAAFALEYAALVITAPNRRRYVLSHVPDLLMVVLPMLRPLRLRRVLRLGTVAMSGAQRSRHLLVSRAPLYATGLASLAAWFIGAEEDVARSREAGLEAVVARLEAQVDALSRSTSTVDT
jgi:voltage-gated potassium channel